MSIYKTKREKRERRHMRLRQKISGSSERPRFSVNFTQNHIYVQFIDDDKGNTLASVSTLSGEFKETKAKANLAGAEILGKIAGEKAVAAGIKAVVFDRGGFRYHGRVKALAEAVRKSGLKF